MSFTVIVRRAAELDLAEAVDWYEDKLPGLGALFLEEFERVHGRLADSPYAYQIVYRDMRRAQLRRFPYLVWFAVKDSVVIVRACLRGSLGPAKIHRRLG